jgi:pimeloyl-ACP methyl ester carboxylesterase
VSASTAITEAERIAVRSGEVRLAVRRTGPADAPALLLVHGYPDTASIWTPVIGRLRERFQVVSFDNRGAGESTAPAGRGGYALTALVGDIAAVIEATAPPGSPMHLVGHDWGAITGWDVLDDPRTAARIASFTAISGPPLDHVGRWVRRQLRRPTPAGLAAVARQAAGSSYIAALLCPGLPSLMWRRLGLDGWRELLARAEDARIDAEWPAPTFVADAIRGAALYRANIPRRIVRPRAGGGSDIPVQLVIATRERFIHPRVYDGLEHRHSRLVHRRVEGGHWVPRTHPDELAQWITEHVDAAEQVRE